MPTNGSASGNPADTPRCEKHGEARPAVHAGVFAVGDERGTPIGRESLWDGVRSPIRSAPHWAPRSPVGCSSGPAATRGRSFRRRHWPSLPRVSCSRSARCRLSRDRCRLPRRSDPPLADHPSGRMPRPRKTLAPACSEPLIASRWIQRESLGARSLAAINRTIGASCPLISQSAGPTVSS
jgi:hypothetical protein